MMGSCSFRDDASDRVVHIGEQYALRQEISSYLLRSMRVPVLLGILVIAILIWLSVDRGLKPLFVLAVQMLKRKRKPDDFSPLEPVSTSTVIRPIVDALNTLLARVRGTFDAERRFTGDAAHKLHTPLAALKVQTQVALGATHELECRTALNGILAGVAREPAGERLSDGQHLISWNRQGGKNIKVLEQLALKCVSPYGRRRKLS